MGPVFFWTVTPAGLVGELANLLLERGKSWHKVGLAAAATSHDRGPAMIGTKDDRKNLIHASNFACVLWLAFTALDQWARELGGVWILPGILGDADLSAFVLAAAPYLALVWAAISLGAAAEAKGHSRWWGVMAFTWLALGWVSLGLMAIVVLLRNRWEDYGEAPIPVGGNPFGYGMKGPIFVPDSNLEGLVRRKSIRW